MMLVYVFPYYLYEVKCWIQKVMGKILSKLLPRLSVYGEQSNKRYEFVDVVLLKILKSDHLT